MLIDECFKDVRFYAIVPIYVLNVMITVQICHLTIFNIIFPLYSASNL